MLRLILQLYLGSLLFAAMSLSVWAAIDVHEFANDVERERYQNFIDEMRCPKCQNQNLSGSDSPIATDLRNQLFLMIKEGRSDKEIVDFMVERYGEFILYKPRLSSATLMLWALPAILLVIGIVVLIVIVRQRRLLTLEASTVLSTSEQKRLHKLLQGREPISTAKHDNTDAAKAKTVNKGEQQ